MTNLKISDKICPHCKVEYFVSSYNAIHPYTDINKINRMGLPRDIKSKML